MITSIPTSSSTPFLELGLVAYFRPVPYRFVSRYPKIQVWFFHHLLEPFYLESRGSSRLCVTQSYLTLKLPLWSDPYILNQIEKKESVKLFFLISDSSVEVMYKFDLMYTKLSLILQ